VEDIEEKPKIRVSSPSLRKLPWGKQGGKTERVKKRGKKWGGPLDSTGTQSLDFR